MPPGLSDFPYLLYIVFIAGQVPVVPAIVSCPIPSLDENYLIKTAPVPPKGNLLMRGFRLSVLTILLVLFLLPASTWADGITWTVNNITLNDGGTVSGSFIYDAATNLYSSPDVTSTAGFLFSGAVYTSVTDAIFSNSTVLGLGPNPTNTSNFTGETFLELMFLNPLTDAGGADPVFAVEFVCTDATCSAPIERTSLSGAVVTTPEPSTALLLILALLGFAAFLTVTHRALR